MFSQTQCYCTIGGMLLLTVFLSYVFEQGMLTGTHRSSLNRFVGPKKRGYRIFQAVANVFFPKVLAT